MFEELAALFALPEYCADMACEPTENALVEKVALPTEIVTAGWTLPSIVNVTVPVAVLGDTVAVKVTS